MSDISKNTTGRPHFNMKYFTHNSNEADIIKAVIALYNADKPFDLDATYSKGQVWKKLMQPRIKTDIAYYEKLDLQADVRNLPFKSSSMGSVFFDPPFVVGPSPKPGIIRDRFSCYKNIPDLWQFYKQAIQEIYRILKTKGLFVMKCQDTVSGGINYFSHVAIMLMAQHTGFYCKDLFVLSRKSVLWSPNMQKQQHARKNHCYYLVFLKLSKHRKGHKIAAFQELFTVEDIL